MRRLAIAMALVLLVLPWLSSCGTGGAETTTTSSMAEASSTNDTTAVPVPTDTTTPDPFEWPMAGPTIIDVPANEVAKGVVSVDGAVVEYGSVRLTAPAGAVKADTSIVITRLEQPFKQEETEADDPGLVTATPISSAYDFGPAGVRFDSPVTITLPYDPGMGPDGRDPARIAVAYWDGKQWRLAGGIADPDSRTVSVQVRALDGSVTVAVLIGTLIGGAVFGGIKWWYGGEGTNNDPVADGNASQWVTPNDPVVQDRAKKASLRNNKTGETRPLDDPDLASWLEEATSRGEKTGLVYADEAGKVAEGRYNTGKGSNWQKPADYFTRGTDQLGPVSGDCTDTTNAAVSVFIAKGFRAKGVYGYGGGNKSRPHVWGEVVIGGKLYRIDETGYVINPESAAFHYSEYEYVTDADDPHYRSMWDDRAQQPYDPDWWKSGDLVGDWSWTGVKETNGVYGPSDRAYVWTFKQEGGGYALYYGDTYICPVEFDGRNVSFVTQVMGNAEWNGVLEGDSITGTQVWEGGKWEGAWQATRVLVSGNPR